MDNSKVFFLPVTGKLRWTESADIVDREWHVVAGLRYGSVYEVRVIAKNCGDAEFYRQTTSPVRQIQIGEKISQYFM